MGCMVSNAAPKIASPSVSLRMHACMHTWQFRATCGGRRGVRDKDGW